MATEQQQPADLPRQPLIERYIVPDPADRGPAYARLAEYGTPVWALVAYYQGDAHQSLKSVALGYDLPDDAVLAALAYYRRYRAEIDAWLRLNSSAA